MVSSLDNLCQSIDPVLRPLSRIPNPANTIHYEENAGRRAFLADPQGLPGRECGTSDFPLDVVVGWHGRPWMFNVTFVDGHSATVKIKGYENPALPHYPYQNPSYWTCVTVRGDGFQRDVLPSPPVKTDLLCN
jgi:prepilin-type processing-associated H-X9-DG protein